MSGNVCLVTFVVLSYWLIATTMIFVNKRLMSAANESPSDFLLNSEPKTSKAEYAASIPKVQMTVAQNTDELKMAIDNVDCETKNNEPLSSKNTNCKKNSMNGIQSNKSDGKTAFGFVSDTIAKSKIVPTNIAPSHFATKARPVFNLSRNSQTDNNSYRTPVGPNVQIKIPQSDTVVSRSGGIWSINNVQQNDVNKKDVQQKGEEPGETFGDPAERRRPADISVLVVWAQSVFGLTFLMTFRALVFLFRLPLKELRHLQLPAGARRGDLDLPLAAVAQTSALIFNNLTLRLISVSFYQIARALTLVFVTALSACILRERIAKRVGMACLLMIAGFYVGVDQEVLSQGVPPIGVVYGSIASFFAACYGVLFKRLQLSSAVRHTAASNGSTTTASSSRRILVNLHQREKNLNPPNKNLTVQKLMAQMSSNMNTTPKGSSSSSSTTQGQRQYLPDKEERNYITDSNATTRIAATTLQFTYYNYLTCSIALAPAVFASCQARDFLCLKASRDAGFWCLLALSGLAGIAMSWVSSLQISLTSPLTHNMSINAKSVLLTLTAVAWNGETRAGLWWAGNALVLLGVALYTATRLRERVLMQSKSGGNGGGRPGLARGRRLKLPVVIEDVRY